MMTRCAAVMAVLLAGCGSSPQWSVVLDEKTLTRTALSVWGTNDKDVYVAGGGLGNGSPALALHYDGQKWREIATGSTDSFWWVWGTGPENVYFVGEHGAIYRYDGRTATSMPTPTTATLFGVWGAAPNNIWAVGGTPVGGGSNDVILHFDGTAWTEEKLAMPTGATFFKVWGSSANDVFIVGQGGTILHYDGSSWSPQLTGTVSTLLTVFGRAGNDVYAVGGPDVFPGGGESATFLHYDGASWSKQPLIGRTNGLNGVVMTPKGEAMAVGIGGVRWHYDRGAWRDESTGPVTQDLHAVWLGSDGQGFAVGGNFLAPISPTTARSGLVAYYGTHLPPSRIEP